MGWTIHGSARLFPSMTTRRLEYTQDASPTFISSRFKVHFAHVAPSLPLKLQGLRVGRALTVRREGASEFLAALQVAPTMQAGGWAGAALAERYAQLSVVVAEGGSSLESLPAWIAAGVAHTFFSATTE